MNAISPAFIDHLARFNPRIHGPYSLTADDFQHGIPMGRFCAAMDIAHAAVFLASEESSFMTGADLKLDGGARFKDWPWMPGKCSGIATEEYLARSTRHSRGEPNTANRDKDKGGAR